MKIAVLAGTGRTGRLVVAELVDRGHHVVALVRHPASAGLPEPVQVVQGDVRDEAALRTLVQGVDAVVSALGPRSGDRTLHREVAPLLVRVLGEAGVRRFVGVSGAGIDVPGDRKSLRDRIVSGLMQRLGGEAVRDKALEHETWQAGDLDWTLVRPPRLLDGEATGEVEHAAGTSPRSTSIRRADLAAFLVDVVEQGGYVRQAPLVAGIAGRSARSGRAAGDR
jgi:putative NADH-flavin reductase